MTDTMNLRASETTKSARKSLLGRFAAQYSNGSVPFEVVLPDGSSERFGKGTPTFRLTVNDKSGLRALATLDEGRIADAYMSGAIDLDGDMMKPFELRATMSDFHIVTEAWRYIQPFLFGQVQTNKRAITTHYDLDPEFFLSFLDPKTPCYTQGVYENDDETLDVATTRKFAYCFDKLKLKPGDRILEIGPGWGAWFEYASARGVKCTGISISQVSIDYLNGRAKKLGYDWELIFSDLFEFEPGVKYDAIVIMGVIEHLPDYLRVMKKFASLLKPGGRVFLDGSAAYKKYELSSFMVKYNYAGNHSFLVLPDLLDKIAKTPLLVEEVFDDSRSYRLTLMQWAKNLDSNKDKILKLVGTFDYRRFRLYLWGAAAEFYLRRMFCYRMIIRLPEGATE